MKRSDIEITVKNGCGVRWLIIRTNFGGKPEDGWSGTYIAIDNISCIAGVLKPDEDIHILGIRFKNDDQPYNLPLSTEEDYHLVMGEIEKAIFGNEE